MSQKDRYLVVCWREASKVVTLTEADGSVVEEETWGMLSGCKVSLVQNEYIQGMVRF